MKKTTSAGKVYLIGAGPGDPGLLTLRGAECLARADAVLYDYLANPAILKYANPDAELICLGKHGSSRVWTQDEVNQRMVKLAGQGRVVARLKGGDPAVFARGAEEAEILSNARIPFEIVPGITAALAASSCAGIPITHRDCASAVALVTGQEGPGKIDPSLDFDALAKFPGTLVFYMGVTTVEHWTTALIRAGKNADTPAAIIRRCSAPDQLTIRCTLGTVRDRMADQPKLRPPAIVIIGDVVTLADTLSWFDKRPLFGQTVLVTRPAHQAESLVAPFTELGAEVLVQPAIEISPPRDLTVVDDVLDRLSEFHWLVFSSANGVHFFLKRLFETDRDCRALGACKLAAIGPGTTDALREYHLQSDVQPAEYRAEALAATLKDPARGQRVLLIRASRGREVLAEELRAGGADVEQVVVYASTDVAAADAQIAARLAKGEIDWVTVSSSAIAKSLHRLFGKDLRQAKLASISPVTSATLRQLGLPPAVEATEYTMDGIVAAVLADHSPSVVLWS